MHIKKFISVLLISLLDLITPYLAYAYPIPVTRFEDEGSVYVESSSIIPEGRYIKLTYVENFTQPRNYGENKYLSKATDIRIDCPNRGVFALKEYYYSDPDRSGNLMGAYVLSDPSGSYAEHGSWVSQIVAIGCK